MTLRRTIARGGATVKSELVAAAAFPRSGCAIVAAIMEQDLRRDLTRTVLAILIIGGLIAASVWILRPFLAATIWSAMIVVTTWRILRKLHVDNRAGAVARYLHLIRRTAR